MISSFPQILTVPVKAVKQAVLFLKERCLFTTQQVSAILRDSPAIVVEDEDQLEYKFQVCVQTKQKTPKDCVCVLGGCF